MFSSNLLKNIINYTDHFTIPLLSSNKRKDEKICTCNHITKKPLPKLREPKTTSYRFVQKAQILSFKKHPTFKFWDKYESRCTASYFQQAFTDLIEIGHGSFGIVYSAVYRGDGRRYAIKKMHYPYASQSNRTKMQREVLIHEQFENCPGILKFYGAWEEEDRLYLQLELCTYSLADIKFCPSCTNSKKISTYAKDILTGLKHLHEKNILHFDVKPENIFITEDFHCKIGDFGIAVRLNCDNLNDVDEGDGRYLALEVLNNPPTLSADVYSVGMTLLEIAACVDLPSSGSEFHKIRKGMINPEWLNCVEDPVLRALILWMINPNPVKRPSATIALASFSNVKSNIFGVPPIKIVLILIVLSFLISGIILLY